MADVDVDRFDALVRRAADAEPFDRRVALEEATALAGDDPLADEPYAGWALLEREHYCAHARCRAVLAEELGVGGLILYDAMARLLRTDDNAGLGTRSVRRLLAAFEQAWMSDGTGESRRHVERGGILCRPLRHARRATV